MAEDMTVLSRWYPTASAVGESRDASEPHGGSDIIERGSGSQRRRMWRREPNAMSMSPQPFLSVHVWK